MRIPRIYHPAPLAAGVTIELAGDAANHIARVLRLSVGAPLVLFNGDGAEYAAVITALDKRRVAAEVTAQHRHDRESPLDIWLAQGISRGERMDYTVQKAVELGVSRIIPLFADRCGVPLAGGRHAKRVQRWRARRNTGVCGSGRAYFAPKPRRSRRCPPCLRVGAILPDAAAFSAPAI